MIICPNLSCSEEEVVTVFCVFFVYFFIFQIMFIIFCCLLFKQIYNVEVYLIMSLQCHQLVKTLANQGEELNKLYTFVQILFRVLYTYTML